MSLRPRIGRLHVLTDEVLQSRFSHVELAELAAAGGADVVQYREKRAVGLALLQQTAREMLHVLGPGMQLIINDRPDVAMAIRATGVHVGKHDLPALEVRRILGEEFLIGGTANSLHEARAQFDSPIDYIGVGPVYGTTSKADPAPRLGLEPLHQIALESPHPIIAIGGIRPQDVKEVLATGVHGIAVLSGISCTDDPLASVRRYRQAMDQFESVEKVSS